jgi:hypothetical protein
VALAKVGLWANCKALLSEGPTFLEEPFSLEPNSCHASIIQYLADIQEK